MRCKIIAEVGWSHIGDMNLAKEMIDAAVECGADFVKFQTWSVSNLVSGEWDNDGRREIYEKAELSKDDHQLLFDYVKSKGANFLTSVFNHKDLWKLPEEYSDYIKIPSTEITNSALLEAVYEKFDHLIISTGASTFEEVVDATWDHLDGSTLMHCVSAYPCSPSSACLNRIRRLQKFSGSVGYSDHTTGIAAPAFAISCGCEFVEKHFTTDPSLPGRDNKFAATPDILRSICQIRDDLSVMTECSSDEIQEVERGARDYRGRWGGEQNG